MYVSGRDIQKGLTVLGYQPGPIDGVVGDATRKALNAWVTTLPEATVAPAGCRRAPIVRGEGLSQAETVLCEGAHITPDAAATVLKMAAERYTAPPTAIEPARRDVPVVPEKKFFRMDNPWLWVLLAIPAAGLGYMAWRKWGR